MKNEKKWVKWLIVLAVCSPFIFVIAKNSQAINSSLQKKTPSIEIKDEEIKNGIKVQTESKEADAYSSFVMIPFTEIEEIDVPIGDWAFEQEEIFYEKVEDEKLNLNKEIAAHFNLQTDIHKASDHFFSFVLTAEQFIENEKRNSFVRTYTVDIKQKSFIELFDLFDKEKIETDDLLQIIAEQANPAISREQIGETKGLNWSVEGEHLAIYIESDNDAKQESTTTRHEISLLHLHEYMEDSYKKLLISENLAEKLKKSEQEKKIKVRELKPDGKYVALTFDDGPHAKYTEQILDILKKYDAKATFYMLSRNVRHYPEIAKRVAEDGHEIGNHSATHVNLNATKEKRIDAEIIDSKQQIEEMIGYTIETFRPPYGEYNQYVLDEAEKSDQSVVLWSVDTLDWKNRNANSVYQATINETEPGSIILLHDIHATTVDALPLILNYFSKEGYECVTVSELLPLLEDKGPGPYFGN